MLYRKPLHLLVLLVMLTVGVLVASAAPTLQTAEEPAPPELGTFDPASVADIDVSAYPILPEVTAHAKQIYADGIARGNNPRVFSKIGDCMTAAPEFLVPFGTGDYDLGDNAAFQSVIDYYSVPARSEGFELDSFANPGLSTASGFNTASILDPLWADPNWCRANESPLTCEYRNSQPSIALIMFGTNDVYYLEADPFNYYLRTIVIQTINSGIVPVLHTFPTRPEYPEKSALFNQIIVKVAQDYDLPLINLWLALEDLPDKGVDTVQTIHLTKPENDSTGNLTPANLKTGYTLRNLVTLEALDVLMKGLSEE